MRMNLISVCKINNFKKYYILELNLFKKTHANLITSNIKHIFILYTLTENYKYILLLRWRHVNTLYDSVNVSQYFNQPDMI